MAAGQRIREGGSDRAVRRLLLAAMAVGFIALIAAAIGAWSSYDRNRRYNLAVEHSHQVRQALSQLQVTLEQSETARRGYLLTGDSDFERTYRLNAGDLVPRIDRIARQVSDNPLQIRASAAIREAIVELVLMREASMVQVGQGFRAEAVDRFRSDDGVVRLRAIRSALAEMSAAEARLLAIRSAEQERTATRFVIAISIAGALIVAVAIVSLLTVLRYVRDLGASRAALNAFNAGLEIEIAKRTADLTRANDEIQRFAYIVSHDLRSPLVNVMGFTSELETAGATIAALVERVEREAPHIVTDDDRAAVRSDLPEAIGFIRASTGKMDRLINAILKLSREGRRTITPEPLSLERIVDGIRDTLQHRLDAAGAEIAVPAALPGIVSDRLAIEQVFGNVIENAVKYLDPTRPGRIEVRGRVEGTRALFEIADNGRGIAAADHARIFDLFRRAGTQDQPGEGIGLAHVRALTYRLGGVIDVVSELGQGATFRINLPLKYSEAQGHDR